MFMKYLVGLILYFIGIFVIGAETLHLGEIKQKIKDGKLITQAYRERWDEKKIQPLLKKNKKLREKYLRELNSSTRFVRGEIEDEATLNALMELMQLSILKMRLDAQSGNWLNFRQEVQVWFSFAADFSYEESSLIGLKVAGVIRSLLLDELEFFVKTKPQEIAREGTLRAWFLKVRAPWPIDRMILAESKRFLAPALLSVAEKVANNLQKNPYLTSAEALEQVPGGKPKSLDVLKVLWEPSHIGMMKAEITRIGKLKVQLAVNEYLFKNNKKADKMEDLIQAKLLDGIPIDYNTGKPMELDSQNLGPVRQ